MASILAQIMEQIKKTQSEKKKQREGSLKIYRIPIICLERVLILIKKCSVRQDICGCVIQRRTCLRMQCFFNAVVNLLKTGGAVYQLLLVVNSELDRKLLEGLVTQITGDKTDRRTTASNLILQAGESKLATSTRGIKSDLFGFSLQFCNVRLDFITFC